MDKERYTQLERLVRYYNEHDETKGASKFLFERLAWEISRLPFKDFCMTSDYLPRPGVRSIDDENYKPNPDKDEMEIKATIFGHLMPQRKDGDACEVARTVNKIYKILYHND